ncbi:MAG: ABC transporter ATP-binding protein [Candidatus Gracilibacteria bacterium]|nr:ABC transporter ATP-binding protein [Candidatus Gracilibacteria bacterium]MDD3646858.1 ABC transporter ATP-binding protein [Candidatus Gracilibacteria bacterium]
MNALEIKDLVKTYSGKEVLKGINFTIEKGDFYALLGHNGAGKTTTIGIVTDLVNKNSGSVKVFGVDIDKDFDKAKSYIGVVPQEHNFNIFQKVIDVPVIQAGYYGVPKKIALERTEKLLQELGLWEKRNAEARELSGGMKRRLMIARALVHEPKLLILDEPTAGVDVELRQTTWEFIKKLNSSGTTILLTTHYLEEVEALCNKVAIINKGEIIEDTTTKKLLKKLNEEVVLLDTSESMETLPEKLEKKYLAKISGEHEIEITLKKSQTINELIGDLNKEDITITSFRNKSSRIEQLFINLTR